jgi:hypothetical protein
MFERRAYRVCRVVLALALLSTFSELASSNLCHEMQETLLGAGVSISVVASVDAAEIGDSVGAVDAVLDDAPDAPGHPESGCEACICCCPHLLVAQRFTAPAYATLGEAQRLALPQVPTSFLPATYRPPRR